MSSSGVHRHSFINAVIDRSFVPHNNLWLRRSEAPPRGRKCATGFHPGMRVLMVFIYLFLCLFIYFFHQYCGGNKHYSCLMGGNDFFFIVIITSEMDFPCHPSSQGACIEGIRRWISLCNTSERMSFSITISTLFLLSLHLTNGSYIMLKQFS